MMLIAIFVSQMAFAMNVSPTPFPVFLKEGFSSILEFEEAPTQVVLGNQNLFQVERLDRSIVIKPVVSYATTNMFVYFKKKEMRLFILSAAEDNKPTYFKKFTSLVAPKPQASVPVTVKTFVRGAVVTKSAFDKKKDYLTVDLAVAADSSAKLIPDWERIRLKYKDRYVNPSKVWSARREVQRDSKIEARLIFTKPNVPLDMKDVSVIVPLKGSTAPLTANLKVVRR
jgi:hypothetical protein